ncbi:MAG: phosphatidylserine decarboxylase family protein, partial [Candidatus Marinimicrobia bacterium]|nr:phosphatidylserine decarboxylase family protein [Candidatus Neomarinimicrobiota bacterium]
YNPGKFFGAFKNKASDKNEQTSIIFQDDKENIFKIKQIAGFVARRIVNHMDKNLDVNQGDKLGFIKFGSRVEIIVPANFKVKVRKGMKVRGCKTIIGNFSDDI